MKGFALTVGFVALGVLPVAAQEVQRVAYQPSDRAPYSAAIQVGNTYWLSGKVAVMDETIAVTDGRVAAETHNIMRAFGELLQELGMDYHDLVRATVYLVDIDGYDEMNEAYAQYFEGGDAPARATVAVSELVRGSAIEISFIAVKTDS